MNNFSAIKSSLYPPFAVFGLLGTELYDVSNCSVRCKACIVLTYFLNKKENKENAQ